MVIIRVTDWDEGVAWTDFTGYHPRDLERRLVRLTGGGRSEVKRLVPRLKDREWYLFTGRGRQVYTVLSSFKKGRPLAFRCPTETLLGQEEGNY